MIAAPIAVELGEHIGRQEPDGPQAPDLVVFLVLGQHLDTLEFRELTLADVQARLPAWSLPTLSRCVRRLVDLGYLVRAARPSDGRGYSYRIPLSRRRAPSFPRNESSQVTA